ncbi:unnamed protein product [Lampetra fluviatilis]
MEEVERWALGGLPALREVYLGANSLSTFPASAFAPPPSAPGLTAASVLIGGGSDNAVGDVGSCDAANADVSVRSGGSGVTTLDLGSNSISVLQAGDLQWLLELNTLNLSKNQITEVSSGFLRGPRRLRRLLMSANRLMSVAGIFPEDLGLLEALDLRSNYLSKLPAGNFANLTSLLLLNVADNQIAEAEDGAFDGLAALVRLDLGGNKLGLRPLGPRAFEGLVNLTNLEFNNNYLHYASAGAVRSPPFTPLRSLTHLFLNSQRKDGMVNFPSNFLQGLATLQELHAGQLYLSALDAGTFLPTPNLRYLDLGSNPLCGVEPALLRPVPLLDELHLRGVRLDDVTFLSRLNLSLLRVLRVSNNRIGEVSAADLGALPRLQLLDIVGNPLSCGCDNEWLRDFLLNSSHVQAPGLWRVHCGFPLSRRGELFVRFDASQCRNRSGPLLFACCSCAVALVMLAATVFRFWRWHLLYGYHLLAAWFGEHKRRTRPPGGPIRYDAFVSYNSDDEEWVMRQLLPQLEGAGMRLCLHHRDFVPGKDIVENIMDGIYASRRTLCIVTRSYLRSEWCSKELQVAAFRLFEENQDVLVLLFLERIPHNELSAYLRMRRTIRSRTYITWPGARGDSFARRGRRGRSVAPAGSEGACKLFWHRVVSALGPEDEGHGVAEEEGPLGAPLMVPAIIKNRYEVLNMLGQGSYGQVFRCFDFKEKQEIALKVSNNTISMTTQNKYREAVFLKQLRNSSIIRFEEHFVIEDQQFLVLEYMSKGSLWEVFQNGALPLVNVQRYARSVMKALKFLKKKGVVHADIKAPNILIKDHEMGTIKLADFGLSFFENESVDYLFSTQGYRAPEILLNLRVGTPLDMWSAGCIFAELSTGQQLLPCCSDLHEIVGITEILGKPPREMLTASPNCDEYFDVYGRLNWACRQHKTHRCSLNQFLGSRDLGFLDFINSILCWNPDTRCTPASALKHSWMNTTPGPAPKHHVAPVFNADPPHPAPAVQPLPFWASSPQPTCHPTDYARLAVTPPCPTSIIIPPTLLTTIGSTTVAPPDSGHLSSSTLAVLTSRSGFYSINCTTSSSGNVESAKAMDMRDGDSVEEMDVCEGDSVEEMEVDDYVEEMEVDDFIEEMEVDDFIEEMEVDKVDSIEEMEVCEGDSIDTIEVCEGDSVDTKEVCEGDSIDTMKVCEGDSIDTMKVCEGNSIDTMKVCDGDSIDTKEVCEGNSIDTIEVCEGDSIDTMKVCEGDSIDTMKVCDSDSIDTMKVCEGDSIDTMKVCDSDSIDTIEVCEGDSIYTMKVCEGDSIDTMKVCEGNSIDTMKVCEGDSIDTIEVCEGDSIDTMKVCEGDSIDTMKVSEGDSVDTMGACEGDSVDTMKVCEGDSIDTMKVCEGDSVDTIEVCKGDSIDTMKVCDSDSIDTMKVCEGDSVEEMEVDEGDSVEEMEVCEGDSIDTMKVCEGDSVEDMEVDEGDSVEEMEVCEGDSIDTMKVCEGDSVEEMEVDEGDSVEEMEVSEGHSLASLKTSTKSRQPLHAKEVDVSTEAVEERESNQSQYIASIKISTDNDPSLDAEGSDAHIEGMGESQIGADRPQDTADWAVSIEAEGSHGIASLGDDDAPATEKTEEGESDEERRKEENDGEKREEVTESHCRARPCRRGWLRRIGRALRRLCCCGRTAERD